MKNKTTTIRHIQLASYQKTNLFALLPGGKIFVDKTKTPWTVLQMFMPGRGKIDFLFGAN